MPINRPAQYGMSQMSHTQMLSLWKPRRLCSLPRTVTNVAHRAWKSMRMMASRPVMACSGETAAVEVRAMVVMMVVPVVSQIRPSQNNAR